MTIKLKENAFPSRKERKNRLIADFRAIVVRLNAIEEELHAGGLSACRHDALLIEYRNLSVRVTHVEDELTNDFGVNTENL